MTIDNSKEIKDSNSISGNFSKSSKKPAVEFEFSDEELDRVSGGVVANTTRGPGVRVGDDWY